MRREDEVRDAVLDILNFVPGLNASGVEVTTTSDHVVHLNGWVEGALEKRAVEAVTRRVLGVESVTSAIRVRPAPVGVPTDEVIVEAATQALRCIDSFPADFVRISVWRRWIKLDGEVNESSLKARAHDAVRGLPGVKGVMNHLVVVLNPLPVRSGGRNRPRKGSDLPDTTEREVLTHSFDPGSYS